MSKRTSLTLVLATLAVGAMACGSSASTQNEAGGPVDGGGGSGAGTSDGAGPVGGGGGSSLPTCEPGPQAEVYACAIVEDAEVDAAGTATFTGVATVTAVRAAGADEPCADFDSSRVFVDSTLPTPEVIVEATTEGGETLTFGARVPGFSVDSLVVGDVIDVDFSYSHPLDEFESIVGHLRIERDDALVVAIGANDAAGLNVEQGERRCYSADDSCGVSRADVIVTPEGGEPVEIGNDESEVVGGLYFTLAQNIHVYDVGGNCNFGRSPESLIGAAPAVGR